MLEKLSTLWPEITLFITTCIVMVVGLSPKRATRALCAPLCAVGLIVAGVMAFLPAFGVQSPFQGGGAEYLPGLATFGKGITAVVGLLLLLLAVGTVDREYEASLAGGKIFDPLRSTTAEFYAFFLFSLTGLMLCAGADDLIWLFLALELTSLPTYVMVTISTRRNRSMEAGVKYFFLGALGAAVFLYGFALIYGGTGHTDLAGIQAALSAQAAETGQINLIALAGILLSILGICFKIAAVPMHFYTPDVYEGAASPVSAFLAFTPKAAGFFALLLITGAVGWQFGQWGELGGSLPEPVRVTLMVIAGLTMTVGNVLAWLQTSVKRVFAYSSIAHSGYMLVGVIAGPGDTFATSGIAAVLFYLLCYGVMNLGGFAAIACLRRRHEDGTTEEADTFDEIQGLCQTRPVLGWMLVISAAGLLGLPPLLGFWGKLPLFTAGISAGEIPLVVLLGLNSAIGAFYYLKIIKSAMLESADDAATVLPVEPETEVQTRRLAGVISAVGVVALTIAVAPLTKMAFDGAEYRETVSPDPSEGYEADARDPDEMILVEAE